MRYFFIYFFFLLCIHKSDGQSLFLSSGIVNHSNVIHTNMVNPFWIKRDRPYLSVGLSAPLTNKINLGFTYEELDGWTYAYSEGINELFGYGSSRVKLRRYGLFVDYDFEVIKSRLCFSPILVLSYEANVLQQSLGRQLTHVFDNNEKIDYEGTAEVEVYEGGQLLPAIGFSMKLRLIKGLHVFGTLKWSFGTKTYQDMYVEYSYLGEPQQTAHISDNGTGFIRLLGISYDLNIMKPLISK